MAHLARSYSQRLSHRNLNHLFYCPSPSSVLLIRVPLAQSPSLNASLRNLALFFLFLYPLLTLSLALSLSCLLLSPLYLFITIIPSLSLLSQFLHNLPTFIPIFYHFTIVFPPPAPQSQPLPTLPFHTHPISTTHPSSHPSPPPRSPPAPTLSPIPHQH